MTTQGHLIAIEGTDGSGKQTQTELLCSALRNLGHELKQLSFPCYDSPSSSLVKLYLSGEFGKSVDAVNAYAASTFYAVDRYASYKTGWCDFYQHGGLIVTDRYTISNAIHQGGKLKQSDLAPYLDWLYDFEYNKIRIPKPDLILFLDMPTELTIKMRQKREAETGTTPDIHEQDNAYLSKCHDTALEIAGHGGWHVIDCATPDKTDMLSREKIHQNIMLHVTEIMAAWQQKGNKL